MKEVNKNFQIFQIWNIRSKGNITKDITKKEGKKKKNEKIMTFVLYRYQTGTSVFIARLGNLIKCLYFPDFQTVFLNMQFYFTRFEFSELYQQYVVAFTAVKKKSVFLLITPLSNLSFCLFWNFNLHQCCFLILSYRWLKLAFWNFILKLISF